MWWFLWSIKVSQVQCNLTYCGCGCQRIRLLRSHGWCYYWRMNEYIWIWTDDDNIKKHLWTMNINAFVWMQFHLNKHVVPWQNMDQGAPAMHYDQVPPPRTAKETCVLMSCPDVHTIESWTVCLWWSHWLGNRWSCHRPSNQTSSHFSDTYTCRYLLCIHQPVVYFNYRNCISSVFYVRLCFVNNDYYFNNSDHLQLCPALFTTSYILLPATLTHSPWMSINSWLIFPMINV